MKNKFFEIDIFKFILVLTMVFRHAPLYVYNQNVIEYSISSFNIYSIFIPVTSGFIFILGYTLALSYKNKKNQNRKAENNKYLKYFILLFSLSLFFALITFFRDNIEKSFIEYFFMYIWNTEGKPGFYILLPLSLVYLINYFYYKYNDINSIVYLFVFCFFVFILKDFYFIHYLLFGVIGYLLGLKIDFNYLQRILTTKFTLVFIILYTGIFFIGYTEDINFYIEFYLLITFFLMVIGLSKYIVLINNNLMNQFIKIASRNILPFYIIHVVGLQLIAKYLSFDSLYSVTVFSLIYFILILFIIWTFRKVFGQYKVV
jgi:hypothetical protein